MDGFPGVRNYGVVDPEDLYDVYCYAEDLNGDRGEGPPGASALLQCHPWVLPGPLLHLIAPCVVKGTARGKETIGIPPSQHCHRVEFMAKASGGWREAELVCGFRRCPQQPLPLGVSGPRFHLRSVKKLGLAPPSDSVPPEAPSDSGPVK